MKFFKIIISFFIFNFSMQTMAAKKFEVEFQDNLTQNTKELQLNGIGIRLATIFDVKVYVAGLYLQTKSNDGKKIIASDEEKQVQMVFKRDVDKDDIQEAWEKGFKNQCQKDECASLKPQLKQLNDLMSNMKEGQKMIYKIGPEKIEVEINGVTVGSVQGSRMGQILLGCFIGEQPPNKELKSGMLGPVQ